MKIKLQISNEMDNKQQRWGGKVLWEVKEGSFYMGAHCLVISM